MSLMFLSHFNLVPRLSLHSHLLSLGERLDAAGLPMTKEGSGERAWE